ALTVDTGVNQETVMVTSVTDTTFTAVFGRAHAAGFAITIPTYVQGLKTTGGSFINTPWLNFPARDAFGNPYQCADLVQGDFNGDGKIDYAAHDLRTGHEWVAINNGSSFTLSDWSPTGNPWAVLPNVTWVDFVVGDFNGDGRADISARVLQSGNVFVAQ